MPNLGFLACKSRMYEGKGAWQLTEAFKDHWPRVLMQLIYCSLSHLDKTLKLSRVFFFLIEVP